MAAAFSAKRSRIGAASESDAGLFTRAAMVRLCCGSRLLSPDWGRYREARPLFRAGAKSARACVLQGEEGEEFPQGRIAVQEAGR